MTPAPAGASRTALRLGVLLHLGAVASAVAALPAREFSPLWLLLFCLPGALFLFLSTGWRPKYLGFTERLALAVMLEIGLSFWIYQTDARPGAQAALTYLLLAPLAFGVLRRRELDVLHSLFLSFCLLLIGAVLERGIPTLQVVGFVVCAVCVLQIEARAAAVAHSFVQAALARASARVLRCAAVAAACVLAAAGLFQLLCALPSAGSSVQTPSPSSVGRPRVGISPSFDLRGSGGPLGMSQDELVKVSALRSGARVPRGLYLRYAYVDQPGLDGWGVFPTRSDESLDLGVTAWRKASVPNVSRHTVRVERLEGNPGLVYVVPGTFQLISRGGTMRVRGNSEAEWFTEPVSSDRLLYDVSYQNLATHTRGRRIKSSRRLLWLPASLEQRENYRDLAKSWVDRGTRAAGDPMRIAAAIARGLERRCDYALNQPTGESKHALDNFLFGDREGYCMHFASATAIMLRMQGVPCRIGMGLYGGVSAEQGERIYGSRHAHAWVEIPFRGLGWIVFDPTPAAALRAVRRVPEFDVGQGFAAAPAEPEPAVDEASAIERAMNYKAVLPWLGLVALLLFPLFRPRRAAATSQQVVKPTSDVRSARRLLGKILRGLAEHHRPRARSQTLERYLAALSADDAVDPATLDALARAFRAYQDVRFGGYALDTGRSASLQSGLAAARAF